MSVAADRKYTLTVSGTPEETTYGGLCDDGHGHALLLERRRLLDSDVPRDEIMPRLRAYAADLMELANTLDWRSS